MVKTREFPDSLAIVGGEYILGNMFSGEFSFRFQKLNFLKTGEKSGEFLYSLAPSISKIEALKEKRYVYLK